MAPPDCISLIRPARIWAISSIFFFILFLCGGYILSQIENEKHRVSLQALLSTTLQSHFEEFRSGAYRHVYETFGPTPWEYGLQISKEGYVVFSQGDLSGACASTHANEIQIKLCSPVPFPNEGLLLLLILWSLISIGVFGFLVFGEQKIGSLFLQFLRRQGIKSAQSSDLTQLAKDISTIEKELEEAKQESLSAARRTAILDLARQVVHDIRTPVSALELVTENPNGKAEQQLLKPAVERIRAISEELLTKTKQIECGTSLQTELAPTSIADLISEILPELKIGFDTRTIAIETRYSDTFLKSRPLINPLDFQRVITNLTKNASEAMNGVGKIEIEGDASDSTILLSIKDNGCGIPEEVQPLLFRKGGTYAKQGGNGLGLHHAKTTVESWGGTISVESRMNEGTAVHVSLPQVPTRHG